MLLKYFISILVIASFALQILAKLSLMAHYQINKKLYIEQLCENKDKPEMNCNGYCVLSQQLKNTEAREEVPGIPLGLQEVKEIEPFTLSNINKLNFSRTLKRTAVFSYFINHYRFFFIKDLIIPPSTLV